MNESNARKAAAAAGITVSKRIEQADGSLVVMVGDVELVNVYGSRRGGAAKHCWHVRGTPNRSWYIGDAIAHVISA